MPVETTETATNQTEAATSTQAAATTGTTLVTAAATEQTTGEQTQATSTEAKTEAAKTEETTAAKTETKTEGAPEKYEFKGAEQFDAKVLEAFTESAKEANLSQDAAQKLLDKVAPALQERTNEQVKQVHQQWTEASTTDKEFGGEKLKENLGIAKKALDQFGSPELRTFLDTSGLGNHPEVIRMLYRAGKAISEDGFVSGHSSGSKAIDPAAVLYDNTAKG